MVARKEIVRAMFDGQPADVVVVFTAEHENGDMARGRVCLVERRDALAVGQAQIQQNRQNSRLLQTEQPFGKGWRPFNVDLAFPGYG